MRPELDIAQPDDWHVHLRDDEMLGAVASYSAKRFGRSLVMPNLVPPICSAEAAREYRTNILAALPESGQGEHSTFDPQMAIYLTANLVVGDLIKGHENGHIFGVKYYPAGATTNSELGGTSLLSFRPVLEALTEHQIPLFVHAEAVDESLDIFDREAAFLEYELALVCDEFPDLRVTVEHLSTAAGVAFVEEHQGIRGSITPHHLSCDRSDLLANGMRPHLYCKPVINSRSNRDALRRAATSGSENFFLGTDSAPHPLAAKENEVVRAGIFNAPYALEVVTEVFHQEDSLESLESFVSLNGARHYGFAPNTQRIRLTRASDSTSSDLDEPDSYTTISNGDRVKIFGVAEARLWSIKILSD